MLFYSHLWDGVLKIASFAAMAVFLFSLHIDERLVGIGIGNGAATFVVVALLTISWILVYRQALSTVAAWLYANVNLGARVSLADAHRLARLFQLDLTMKWIPLKEVKALPRDERRTALLSALDVLGAQRRAMLL